MKSGNLGNETVGSGTVFGAHAAIMTSATPTTVRIQKSLHRRASLRPFDWLRAVLSAIRRRAGSGQAKLPEKPARNVGDD